MRGLGELDVTYGQVSVHPIAVPARRRIWWLLFVGRGAGTFVGPGAGSRSVARYGGDGPTEGPPKSTWCVAAFKMDLP